MLLAIFLIDLIYFSIILHNLETQIRSVAKTRHVGQTGSGTELTLYHDTHHVILSSVLILQFSRVFMQVTSYMSSSCVFDLFI